MPENDEPMFASLRARPIFMLGAGFVLGLIFGFALCGAL